MCCLTPFSRLKGPRWGLIMDHVSSAEINALNPVNLLLSAPFLTTGDTASPTLPARTDYLQTEKRGKYISCCVCSRGEAGTVLKDW